MASILVNHPDGSQMIELTGDVVTIGRHPDNVLCVRDARASRHHCVIEPIDEGFQVRDLGARNGTRVNNRRVETHRLGHGDELSIGAWSVRFVDAAAAPASSGGSAGPTRSESAARSSRRSAVNSGGPPDTGRDAQSDAFELVGAALSEDLPDEALQLDIGDGEGKQSSHPEQRLRSLIAGAPSRNFSERDISLINSSGETLHEALSQARRSTGPSDDPEAAERYAAVDLFRLMLYASFCARATDLHIEPRQDHAAVRLRVDGSMIAPIEFPLELVPRVLGVVKVLCQIDTTRRSSVQDGHFSAKVKGRRVDFRVSLTPSVHGQKLVLRILDTSNAPSRLHELGLSPWMYDRLRGVATRDAGFLLACGPTGSGKTTTLYSCLREIDVEERNTITIEDPPEYSLEGCTQIPIDAQQGSTFASILRSVLRQDPDVIFIGEIRDLETATVAMQAAMTGHLVYSTVHAKDSIGAIFRLLDLGVESYLVANALNVIVAQRLVRVLCPSCKRAVKPTPAQVMRLGHAADGLRQVYIPVGCKRCLRTGFHGRRALFELLELNDAMRDVILRSPSIQEIRSLAEQGLFTTLRGYGNQLVSKGETSMDEIERVVGSD